MMKKLSAYTILCIKYYSLEVRLFFILLHKFILIGGAKFFIVNLFYSLIFLFFHCLKKVFKLSLYFLKIINVIKKIILMWYTLWFCSISPILIYKHIYLKFTFLEFSQSFLEYYILFVLFCFIWLSEVTVFCNLKLTVFTFFFGFVSNLLSVTILFTIFKEFPVSQFFLTNNFVAYCFKLWQFERHKFYL